MFLRLTEFSCFVSLALAAGFAVKDHRASAPPGFTRTKAAPSDQTIDFRINLVSNNLAGLQSTLMDVSNPTSPRFRQWLSKAEVESFAKPTDDTTAAVSSWLSSNNVDFKDASPSGDWVSFSIPVGQANSLFQTEFSVFKHEASGSEITRTLSFSLPDSLQDKIRVVHPTTSFSTPVRGLPPIQMIQNQKKEPVPEVKRQSVPASCNATITPACLEALYSIPTTPATNTDNSIAVAGFIDQFANMQDLRNFLTRFRPDMDPATTFTVTSVDNGQNNQQLNQAGVEADLDIEMVVSLATDVPVDFVTVGDNTQDGDDSGFLDIINALLEEDTPPGVLTVSYGFSVESDLSLDLSEALCDAQMQLTSRGTSILFASGDGGVAASPGEDCPGGIFNPSFPTCPFVTLVGATEFVPERGAELSAGGFSNFFPQQDYQADAVNAYLDKLGDTNAGLFNRSGRAYPDVSAIGQRVEIIVGGQTGLVAGTSCSSPIFASVIGLINDRLLTAGQSTLGFLNPWLYANPQMFHDITTGNNPGCDTDGFPALAGWDPVTGMGTPNFPAMLTAAGL